MAERADAQAKVRLAADLKDRIDVSAFKTRRSMNAEIVARLERSFELEPLVEELIAGSKQDQQTIEDLRHQIAVIEGEFVPRIEALAPQVEQGPGVEFKVKVVGALRDTIEQLAAKRGEPVTKVFRSLLWDAIETYPFAVAHLEKQIARLRKEADRSRNERFGGRVVTAELDLLQRERDELESLKLERLQADRARDEKIEKMMAAMTRVIATASNSITKNFLFTLEPLIMDITTESRILWARLKDDAGVASDVRAEYLKLAAHISELAATVTAAVDAATGTVTPEIPETIRGETK